MKLIVDASIAVKWFFTESHTAEARRLLAHRIVLHAPSLILTEAANVIWKKARRKEIPDAQPYLAELVALSDVVTLRPSADLIVPAMTIALALDHPIYDCLYLACAEAEGVPLVTADKKLREAAARNSVDVWYIGDEDANQRIDAAANGLVIPEDKLRELIAAYANFRDTADSVIETVPLRGRRVRILSKEDRDRYLDTPAYRRLVNLLTELSYDERIDLMALGWLGRGSGSWASLLEHAYKSGINDTYTKHVHYEAGLGFYWQKGIDRLRKAQPA